MKFKVSHAAPNMKEKEIAINTLEELHTFAKEVNESLLITFPGVSSNAWYPYGHPKPREEQGEGGISS